VTGELKPHAGGGILESSGQYLERSTLKSQEILQGWRYKREWVVCVPQVVVVSLMICPALPMLRYRGWHLVVGMLKVDSRIIDTSL